MQSDNVSFGVREKSKRDAVRVVEKPLSIETPDESFFASIVEFFAAGLEHRSVEYKAMTEMRRPTETALLALASVYLSGATIIASPQHPSPQPTPSATAQRSEPERTVWDGVYTETQAQRGARAYQQLCSRCHRENLEGEGKAPALVGARFFDRWSLLSVHDLFFAIQITMSHSQEHLFEPSERVGDIVSFVFRANKIPAGTNELPFNDERTLRRILITRRPKAQ
jgi:hypothetical protein